MRHLLLGTVGLLSMVVAAGSAVAQSTAASTEVAKPTTDAIETVIVTARKRSESVQDIPLAIRVLSSATIEEEGIRRIDDIARRTPGLTFDIGGFPNDTRPALRGMQAERGRPSVAVLLDGQDLSGENLSIAGGTASLGGAQFDLERIEVVKGPQSTLYGRNAFAGAINYITKAPSDKLGGRVAVEIASGGIREARGAFDIPIVAEKLSVRLNAGLRDGDGFYRNPVTNERVGTERSKSFGATVLFKPNSALRILGSYSHSEDAMSEPATVLIGSNIRLPAPGALFGPAPGAPATVPCPVNLTVLSPSQQVSCTRGTVVGQLTAKESQLQGGLNPITGKQPFGMKMDQDLASLNARLTTSFGIFSYRFGYLKNSSEIEQDGDFSTFPASPGLVLSLSVLQQLSYENKHYDNEVRYDGTFGKIDVTAGVQHFSEESSLLNGAQFWLRSPTSPLSGPPFRLSTAPSANFRYPQLATRDTTYWGVYGSVGWQVTDALKVSVEARWNQDRIDYATAGGRLQDVTLSQLVPQCLPQFVNGAVFSPTNPAGTPPPGIVNACKQTASSRSEQLTPRGTMEYKLGDDALIYASVAQGFKPGGFNTNEIVTFVGQGYRPEKVTAYEVGTKTSWFDQSLIFNADVYYNDYTDQQIGIQSTNTTPTGQVITTAAIVNAGKVEIKGLEADFDWRFNQNLRFGFGYAYTDSKFASYIQGPAPGSAASAFAACGVPAGQTSSDQNRAEAGNSCANFSGKYVGKSPKHSLTLSTEWRQTYGSGKDSWFVELNGQYRSSRFTDESNLATLPAYWRASARAGIGFGPVQVIAFVDNLFDDRKIESAQRVVDFGRPEGFAPGRAVIAYLPKPRSIGVRAEMKF